MGKLETISTSLAAAGKVVEDPYLPEVACYVLQLNALQKGRDPGPPCPRITAIGRQRTQGVGLGIVTTPLRAAVWARKNPIAAVAVGGAAVGLLVYVGYRLGKRRR